MRRSKVRQWLNQAIRYAKRTMREDDPNSVMDGLAVILIKSIMPERTISKPYSRDSLDRTRRKFTGDATIFELGTYMYFRLDVWHLKEGYDYHRQSILQERLIPTFLQAFQSSLGVPLADVFNNRMDQYAKILRTEDEPMQGIHFYLIQLMLRTAENRAPIVYDFANFPVMVAPFPSDEILRIDLSAFESAMIPNIFSTVEKAYRLLR